MLAETSSLSLLPGVPAQVADHLTELIVRGELAPGERVQEARVTSAFGVSRGSVREAMQILERRHLVELRPRRGAVVTSLSEKRVRDLFAVLMPLYVTLARSAAVGWQDPADLAPILSIRETLEAPVADSDILALINLSHVIADVACKLADNVYLTRMMHDLRPVFSRCFYRVLDSGPHEIERLCNLLHQLVDSIQVRDADRVAALLNGYGEHQLDVLVDTF